nr:hypothetical protein [Tistrella mobilis]
MEAVAAVQAHRLDLGRDRLGQQGMGQTRPAQRAFNMHLHGGRQPLAMRARPVRRLDRGGQFAQGCRPEDLGIKRGHGREIAVDRAFRYPGLLGHQPAAHTPETDLGDQLSGRLQDHHPPLGKAAAGLGRLSIGQGWGLRSGHILLRACTAMHALASG